jgi:syntaxin 1B/2/3
MADIRRHQGKLTEAHERSKIVTRSGEMKELREVMQQDINAVSKLADAIKKKLQELDRANEQALKRKVRRRRSCQRRRYGGGLGDFGTGGIISA